MKAPTPIKLWAVVVRSQRSEWIHPHTLRRLRKDAKAVYLDQYVDSYRPKAEAQFRSGKVRLARVTVSV